MEKIKKLFTSENIALAIIALVMLNNVEHLAYVHYSIARHWFGSISTNMLHSVVVVLIIEAAIIYFVKKGQDVFAGFFTFCIFVISLIYYPVADYWHNGEWGKLIASLVYSIMFPISIFYFSRVAANRHETDTKVQQAETKYFEAIRKQHEINAELQQTAKKLLEANSKMQQLENKLQQKETLLQEYLKELHDMQANLEQLKKMELEVAASCTCKKCGRMFTSEASRRSHEGKCSGVAIQKDAA